jgi:hypothetical protein
MASIVRATAAGQRSRARENLARNSSCAPELEDKASIASVATSWHTGRERGAERKLEAIEVQHLRASVDLHPVLDAGANDHDVAFDPVRLCADRKRPVEAGEDARHGVAVRRQVARNEREQRVRERLLSIGHGVESTKSHVCSTQRRRRTDTNVEHLGGTQ